MLFMCDTINDAYPLGLTVLREEGSESGGVVLAPDPVEFWFHDPGRRVLWDTKRNIHPFLHLLGGLAHVAAPEFIREVLAEISAKAAPVVPDDYCCSDWMWDAAGLGFVVRSMAHELEGSGSHLAIRCPGGIHATVANLDQHAPGWRADALGGVPVGALGAVTVPLLHGRESSGKFREGAAHLIKDFLAALHTRFPRYRGGSPGELGHTGVRFLDEVAAPMAAAWIAWRRHDRARAVLLLDRASTFSIDWHAIARRWMAARIVQGEEKVSA